MFDQHDPAGFGMFSKNGRRSSQRIQFFKRTEAFEEFNGPALKVLLEHQKTYS